MKSKKVEFRQVKVEKEMKRHLIWTGGKQRIERDTSRAVEVLE